MHVGGGSDPTAGEDLGSDVRPGPFDLARLLAQKACHSEVGEQGTPVGREEHVARSDVTVHDAARMDRPERLCQRRGEGDHLSGCQPLATAQDRCEAPARGMVQDQDHLVLLRHHPAQPDEMRMLDGGEHERLTPRPLKRRRIGPRQQSLERHRVAGRPLARQPHLATAPAPEQRNHVVPVHPGSIARRHPPSLAEDARRGAK